MRYLVSRRQGEYSMQRARLDAIWYVDADKSYIVNRRHAEEAGYTLVRTLTGMGALELFDGTPFHAASQQPCDLSYGGHIAL